MTEQTMINRVARAICAARHDEFNDWNSLDSDETEQFKNEARAAIEAMREPTETMVKAGVEYALRVTIGGEYKWDAYIKDKHKIMIDAALAET